MSDHVNCKQFFERLSELLDDELDQKTGDEIRRHIESCPECIACWSTFKKSVELFKNLGEETVPKDFVGNLKGFIKEHNTE